jgi:hypothetical protein
MSKPANADAAARSVYCPACKAAVNEPCRTPKGVEKQDHHGKRYELADRCGLTPVVAVETVTIVEDPAPKSWRVWALYNTAGDAYGYSYLPLAESERKPFESVVHDVTVAQLRGALDVLLQKRWKPSGKFLTDALQSHGFDAIYRG